MAVPSSGEISLFGIAKELELDTYSSSIPLPTYTSFYQGPPFPLSDMSTGGGGFDTINTNNPATDRPDGSTPHAMSEFYSYDHDAAEPNETYTVHLADDWSDGNISSTRTSFTITTSPFENASLFTGGLENVHVGQFTTNEVIVGDRPLWAHSPSGVTNSSYTIATVVSDQVRFSNTNNPHGQFIKTTDYDFGPSTGTFLPITAVPTTQAIAWRWRFTMSNPNNKDAIADIRMGTSNFSPVPGASNSQYTFMIRDSSDPIPGGLRFLKRSGTSHTTLATAPSTAYTVGTQRDMVVSWQRDKSNNYTWKCSVAPTTTPTATAIDSYAKITVTDTSYSQNYGWTFRAPRFMTTPSTNRNHKIDTFSIARIDMSGP